MPVKNVGEIGLLVPLLVSLFVSLFNSLFACLLPWLSESVWLHWLQPGTVLVLDSALVPIVFWSKGHRANQAKNAAWHSWPTSRVFGVRICEKSLRFPSLFLLSHPD